jgi:hypothetical protein
VNAPPFTSPQNASTRCLSYEQATRNQSFVTRRRLVIHGVPSLEGIKMAKKTKRAKRREWTKSDLRELRGHSRAKTPVAKISKMTKRTERALRQKAFELGLPLGHRR